MRIARLNIQNFRGIKTMEPIEVSDINTFIGKNDSGKSTILRALDCFFNEKKFESKDFCKAVQSSDTTFIEISFFVPKEVDDLALDSDGLLTIRKEFRNEGGKAKISTLYKSNSFVDEKFQDLWNLKEPDLNALIEDLGLKPEKSGRGKTNLVRIEQIRAGVQDMPRSDVYLPLSDLLKNLEKVFSVVSLPQFSLFDAEQDLDVGATNFQSQFKPIISSYFETVQGETQKIEEGLREDLGLEFAEICKFMRKNVSNLAKLNPTTEFDWTKSLKKFDLNLEFAGQAFDVPISHKGSGFKRLLMVAYFEYLASKRSAQNQIFGIEEPETFLHPSAQEDLLKSIADLAETAQFFLTTHSPVFAGATHGENSILVTKKDDGISSYEQGVPSIIERIIEELGIRPNHNLLQQKFLIFVEGKDDVEFLNAAAMTITEKNLDDEGIACVIGGGSALANYADMDLFRKVNKADRYAVIVDGDNGDAAKEKEKERIKARCEADGAIFCRLSKRDIENYCSPEAIKRTCIKEIRDSEGETSQNPRIGALQSMSFSIGPDVDTDPHLASLGFERFKKGTNIKVFKAMTKEEWNSTDSNNELGTFLNSIYSRL